MRYSSVKRHPTRSVEQPRSNTRRSRRYVSEDKVTTVPVKLDEPTPEELRQAIQDARCWWCDREGFKSLASHTSAVHGIDRHQLRDMAGLFESTSVCSPEYRAECASRAKQHPIPPRLTLVRGTKKRLNTAARAAVTARLLAVSSDEQRRAANRAAVAISSKPRACTICGTVMPTSKRPVCSVACRIEAHRRNAAHTVSITSHEQFVKNGLANGALTRKPHPCRVCGTMIPKSLPVLCSRACYAVDQAERNRRMMAVRPKKPPRLCEQPGCEQPYIARGCCERHYYRLFLSNGRV